MPIYEYECRDCRNEFEILVRGDEKVKCPACGKGRLTKKLSVVAAPAVAKAAACPAREMGACGMTGCGGGGCGLGGMM